MKHPDREEWVTYLFGEAQPGEINRLSAHLESCPDCAAEIIAWRRSLETLDEWELPKATRQPSIIAPMFRWAAAAVLVLAAGIALGRMTTPDTDSVRAQVEASVTAAFAQQLQQSVAESQARFQMVAQQERSELWAAFSEALTTAREEDRQAMLTLFEQRQRQEEARYINLRRDLETMASFADQELRAAHFKLTQLAGDIP